jgi:hypothetical protein
MNINVQHKRGEELLTMTMTVSDDFHLSCIPSGKVVTLHGLQQSFLKKAFVFLRRAFDLKVV